MIECKHNLHYIYFQKETLQKSLKSSSLNSMGSSNGSISGNDLQNPPITKHSVQNQLIQVKELEEEVIYTN